ncbi:MAG TPA: squalene--hopene cyclase [Actinomycetota bacterium]|nr:squalene--hopene cyclase [Actinomycetota bacterium]
MATAVQSRVELAAAETMSRARDHLLRLQSEGGWWKGELQTNVTMDAEDLLLRKFLGVLSEDVLGPEAAWIRHEQRDDGTWANFYGGPGDLSTTTEAYAALKLAGDPPDATHMKRAREFILDQGGLERTRVFTRLWLALFGIWSWDQLPALPPEVIFFPSWFPLNVYDFACWARQTIVPLTVVASFRPQRPLGFGLDELRSGAPPPPRHPLSTWSGRFEVLDDWLHAYERRPIRWLRRAARYRAAEWILRRQEADGSWGGIQPPWVYSLMALNLMGYPNDHPVMRAAFEGIDAFSIREQGVRRLEACQSPVWDTALCMIGLSDAGIPGDHPAMLRAADWLLGEEIRVKGDWAVRRPELDPSGWAFEFANDNYPDLDDTAEVVLALHRVDHPDPERVSGAIDRGVQWLIGMQSADGGWGAFDADNTRTLCRDLPFCDFGEVIDPPSADVTAHVVEMLAAVGLGSERPARRGLGWLAQNQEPGGSWFGRWGANHVYGTGAVLPAAVAAGISPHDPRIRRAVKWLEDHQNADGGWGEDLRSYVDPDWVGRGASTASQTAWALLALLAAGERASEAAERGVIWLAEYQNGEGTWTEPLYTGTGFPGDFYINYHLYRLAFPLQALGRYVNGERLGSAG